MSAGLSSRYRRGSRGVSTSTNGPCMRSFGGARSDEGRGSSIYLIYLRIRAVCPASSPMGGSQKKFGVWNVKW